MTGAGFALPRKAAIVDIDYRRIGGRAQVYRHLVLESRPDLIVTFQPRVPIRKPLVVDGLTILEPRAPIIWFTFPGKWYDVGLFHRTNGACTGVYGNVLTPVDFVDARLWTTTDLCLDVWVPRWGSVCILDEDELARAEAKKEIREELATRARGEAAALVNACRAGTWPPPAVAEWSLARAIETCRYLER